MMWRVLCTVLLILVSIWSLCAGVLQPCEAIGHMLSHCIGSEQTSGSYSAWRSIGAHQSHKCERTSAFLYDDMASKRLDQTSVTKRQMNHLTSLPTRSNAGLRSSAIGIHAWASVWHLTAFNISPMQELHQDHVLINAAAKRASLQESWTWTVVRSVSHPCISEWQEKPRMQHAPPKTVPLGLD
eukprot:4357505-Amphidinium_carterae.1